VKENWEKLNTKYQGGHLLSRLIKSTSEYFNSEEKAKEIEAFYATHPVPSSERTVKQSLEKIRLNSRWLERDGAAVAAWLEDWAKKQ